MHTKTEISSQNRSYFDYWQNNLIFCKFKTLNVVRGESRRLRELHLPIAKYLRQFKNEKFKIFDKFKIVKITLISNTIIINHTKAASLKILRHYSGESKINYESCAGFRHSPATHRHKSRETLLFYDYVTLLHCSYCKLYAQSNNNNSKTYNNNNSNRPWRLNIFHTLYTCI